jgi:acyl-CoA synthetase (AMP-forming)/AMP-acid ligase II
VQVSARLELQPDATRYTLPRFLDDVAERYGPRTALRFEARGVRYAELRREARRLAAGLVARGVGKGTRVAVLLANRPEWLVAAFGAALTGAVVVPVNTFATPDELDYVLRHADAAWLLMQPSLLRHAYLEDLLARHREIASGRAGAIRSLALPQLRGVVALGLDEARGAVEPWSALLAARDVSDALLAAIASEIHPADEALVIYTSGTTARPKGVVHRQRTPVIQAWRFAELMGFGPDDRVYSAYPFFWTAGIAMSIGATLAAGATLVVEESFEPGAALATIARERATSVQAWPHQTKAMAEHPEAARHDLSSVRKIEFKSPLAPLAGIEKDEWGIYASYGMSETFTLATALGADAPAERRAGTNGPPLPGTEARIVDPHTGQALAPGEKGEITVRGLTLMAGYAKVEPELFLDPDGFFHTQDGGFLDEAGDLHWTGRLSNLIKTGGANVSPLEIEERAGRFPGVRSAHAVGVPHPALGDAIVLLVLPTEGAPLDVAGLEAHLRKGLSAYKLPRAVFVLRPDEVSFTGSQKVQLEPLRERALAKLAEARITIAGHDYAG